MKLCCLFLVTLFVVTASFAQNIKGEDMPVIGYSIHGTFGQHSGRVYIQTSSESSWQYVFSLPGGPDQGKAKLVSKDTLLYARNDDSLFYYNLKGKFIGSTAKSEMINKFCSNGISSIAFRKGSRGCFHSLEDRIVYTNNYGSFGDVQQQFSGTSHKAQLLGYRAEIDNMPVRDFVTMIPSLFTSSSRATIDDLGFTKKDYEQCKRDIKVIESGKSPGKEDLYELYYFETKKIDFARLHRLLDSVPVLDDSLLTDVLLNMEWIVSTSMNYASIDLVNYNDEMLTIRNTFFDPDYFQWTITLNGYSYQTTSKQVINFIKKVYPAFLDDTSNVKALHKIVRYLYFATNMCK